MGRTPAPGLSQQRHASRNAFYGEELVSKPKFAPGAGGRPAVKGGPMLPANPWAEMAWERQRLLGAMDQPNISFPKYIVKV